MTGRTLSPGEINGKSANVNNCLKNVVYHQYAGSYQDIPMTEVIVVFDADMAAKRNFFLKVSAHAPVVTSERTEVQSQHKAQGDRTMIKCPKA